MNSDYCKFARPGKRDMNTENAQCFSLTYKFVCTNTPLLLYIFMYLNIHVCVPFSLGFLLTPEVFVLFSFLRLFSGRLFNQCRAGEGFSKLLADTKESVHFPTTKCPFSNNKLSLQVLHFRLGSYSDC